MSEPNIIGNSAIAHDSCSLGKLSYHYDENSKTYTITTENGTVITCKRQASSNNASIYLISDDGKELLHLENIAGANIVGSNSCWTKLSLAGCNNCSVDMSQNNNNDSVELWNSDNYKSRNNNIKIGKGDALDIYFDNDDYTSISSSGKYNENTVKSEAKSLWNRVFGYSKSK